MGSQGTRPPLPLSPPGNHLPHGHSSSTSTSEVLGWRPSSFEATRIEGTASSVLMGLRPCQGRQQWPQVTRSPQSGDWGEASLQQQDRVTPGYPVPGKERGLVKGSGHWGSALPPSLCCIQSRAWLTLGVPPSPRQQRLRSSLKSPPPKAWPCPLMPQVDQLTPVSRRPMGTGQTQNLCAAAV